MGYVFFTGLVTAQAVLSPRSNEFEAFLMNCIAILCEYSDTTFRRLALYLGRPLFTQNATRVLLWCPKSPRCGIDTCRLQKVSTYAYRYVRRVSYPLLHTYSALAPPSAPLQPNAGSRDSPRRYTRALTFRVQDAVNSAYCDTFHLGSRFHERGALHRFVTRVSCNVRRGGAHYVTPTVSTFFYASLLC